MSENDWKAYGAIARRYVGSRLEVSVATNSLKLWPTNQPRKGRYVWIDPPWRLLRGDEVIVSGSDYPDHSEASYAPQFAAFCDRLSAIRQSRLEDVRYVGEDATEFAFRHNLRLLVLHQAAGPDAADWYDDWYARDDEMGARGAVEQGDEADER